MKCRSHVLWAEIREIQSIRPELVQETTNKMILIKEKLKAAKDFQKSYVKTFRVEDGDKMMLEVSSWKDVVHFGKKEMLAPRYVDHLRSLKGSVLWPIDLDCLNNLVAYLMCFKFKELEAQKDSDKLSHGTQKARHEDS
ncbi:hypothetical protein Tco_0201008 [Tanacetum coccineum]